MLLNYLSTLVIKKVAPYWMRHTNIYLLRGVHNEIAITPTFNISHEVRLCKGAYVNCWLNLFNFLLSFIIKH